MSSKKIQPKVRAPYLGKLDIGDEDTLDLDLILTHDFDDIEEASESLPGILEWINIRLQQCIEKKMVQARDVKELEARAWLDYKMGKLEEDYPNLTATEKAIDKAALLHPKVVKAHRQLAVSAAWVDRLQNLQLALQMKYDLVRSSEATRRRVFDEPDSLKRRQRESAHRIETEE